MNYRSVQDLNRATQKWAGTLPRDVTLVVGVPRSGMFVALLLALYRDLVVTDLDGFIEGRVFAPGARLSGAPEPSTRWRSGRILVVDDSVAVGDELCRVKQRIAAAGMSGAVEFGAVYVTEESRTLVDHWYEIVSLPRVFEWNIMNHGILGSSCVDIDGVLCRDPSDEENDDGPRYEAFLSTNPPLVVPRPEIGWLVTCRLEKHRARTEDWLRRCGIRYKELVMMNAPDKAAGRHTQFKADHYRRTGAALFIESSHGQAQEIARITGRSVFCMETREMLEPGLLALGAHRPKQLLKLALRQSAVGRQLLHAYRRAVGRV